MKKINLHQTFTAANSLKLIGDRMQTPYIKSGSGNWFLPGSAVAK